MNRWTRIFLAATACAATAAFAQLPQVVTTPSAPSLAREVPANVKPALIAVSTTPPVIAVDGTPDRLSPGARIRDRNNMLVLSGQLAGQTHYTVYRRDAAGLVHEVWLLNQEEYLKVGGLDLGNPEGYKRFYELLDLIWSARYLLLPAQ